MKMTKKISVLFMMISMLLLAGSAQAEQVDKGNAITINPLGAVFGGLDVTYQAGMGNGNLAIGASYWLVGGAVGGHIGYNFNLSGNKIQGFQMGPHVGVLSFPGTSLGTSLVGGGYLAIRPMLELGYQWVWGNGITLKPAASIGYTIAMGLGAVSSLSWGIGLNIGYAF